MRLLTSILYCLLSLFGCDGGSSTTTVTRSQQDGRETLFSRTTDTGGTLQYQCVRSRSGYCHYVLFEDTCAVDDDQGARQCRRRPLDRFSLAVGERREIRGLDEPVRDCVQAERPPAGASCEG